MDDLIFSTVGKLYIELTRLQRVVESQQARINELETVVNNQVPLSKSVAKDGGRP
jgi:hypothetical protein